MDRIARWKSITETACRPVRGRSRRDSIGGNVKFVVVQAKTLLQPRAVALHESRSRSKWGKSGSKALKTD